MSSHTQHSRSSPLLSSCQEIISIERGKGYEGQGAHPRLCFHRLSKHTCCFQILSGPSKFLLLSCEASMELFPCSSSAFTPPSSASLSPDIHPLIFSCPKA